jgi:ribosomal protein S18 acetylase RimI-like enzyme
MTIVNETVSCSCRFLKEDCFPQLYETFIEAFSDYVYPFALTEEQFKNHIILNAVDLTRTAGCFRDGRLVGFSLNGFGEWDGKSTAYDAGTGVIPSFRRQGVSDAMFEMMVPIFKDQGIEQFLLEVITTNQAAIRLYEKLGFEKVRELSLLQCDKTINASSEQMRDIEIRQTEEPDWHLFSRFWKGRPSWQNSIAAINRSTDRKRIITAHVDDECAGYVIFSSNFGRIAQLGVGSEFSGRGVGTRLVQAVQEATAPGYSLQVINADKAFPEVNAFFKSLGFYERLSQHEMIKQI